MAKEKNSSGVSTPTPAATDKQSASGKQSTSAKQSTSRKTASQNRLHVVGAAATSSGAPWTEPSAGDLDQEIRLRAFQMYCERGGLHGGHEDDWLRAEQEVREKYEKFKYGT